MSQPTPKRMRATEPLRKGVGGGGIEQPTHRLRKGRVLPARDWRPALTQPAWRAGHGSSWNIVMFSLGKKWFPATYLLASFLLPALSPPRGGQIQCILILWLSHMLDAKCVSGYTERQGPADALLDPRTVSVHH